MKLLKLPLTLFCLTLTSPLLAAQSAPTVSVALPESAPVETRLQLTGTLTPERAAGLSPRMDGLVTRVNVDAGDVVRKGQILLELDPSLAQLALERSRADVANAQVNVIEAARLLKEARRLVEQQHVPVTQIAAREAELSLAEAQRNALLAAQREQAEQVKRHSLPAPFDGVITRKLTEAGEWIGRGTPVLQLVAIDRVRLDIQVPQEQYREIETGANITVQPDALPGLSLPARIAARVPVATEAAARSFLLRLLIDDNEHRLLPGTTATASIRLRNERSDNVLRIPQDALLRQPDGGYNVFVIEETSDETIAKRRPLRIGKQGNGMIEVIEGLSATEPVVIRGNESLLDGQQVRVIRN